MKDESLKSLVSRLYEEIRSAGECVDLLQNAFIYGSAKFLEECEAKAKEIHRSEKVLTEALVEESKKNPEAKIYVAVPGHTERIGDYIESICNCTRTKIREDILFSDKAISEITFLLQRILDVLKNANDIILARNAIVGRYVKEAEAEIGRSANEFATLHEERLIEGLCMPKASSLYLDILDAIKGIAWHAKEISEKLTS